MKRYWKWGAAVVLSPIIIIMLIVVALYIPPVQNWAVRVVAEYASEVTGMDISVGRVCLVFPLDLGVDVVLVTQRNDSVPQRSDTIADVRNAVVDVRLMPLFRGEVEIDRLDLYGVKVNTADFVAQVKVRGSLEQLSVVSHGISLSKETVRIDKAYVNGAALDIALSDTVPEDTAKSETKWIIDLDDLRIRNSSIALHLPDGTTDIDARFDDLGASTARLDLGKQRYDIVRAVLTNGAVRYADIISIDDMNIAVDSVHFCAPDVRLDISRMSMKEKSGIGIDGRARLSIDLTAFDSIPTGKIRAAMDASVTMPAIADKAVTIALNADGNMQRMNISRFRATMPGCLDISAEGAVENIADTDNMKAGISLRAQTFDVSFARKLMPKDVQKMIAIPAMTAKADVSVDGGRYGATFNIVEGKGNLSGKAGFNASATAYNASIKARNINISHFVKGMGLGLFSGDADINGIGTDPFAPATRINADVALRQLQYEGWNFTNTALTARVKNGKGKIDLTSDNELINGCIGLEALMKKSSIRSTLTAEIHDIDLYRMRLSEAPINVSTCAHIDLSTDLKETYKLQGFISDLRITDTTNVYRPDDMVFDLITRTDTTHAVMDCGDFHLNADVRGGYKDILRLTDRINSEVNRQWSSRIIDEPSLRSVLPLGRFYLSIGQDNPIARTIGRFGYSFNAVNIDLTSSPTDGVNGTVRLDTLKTDAMQIDDIRINLISDSETMGYDLRIENGKDNPQYSFLAQANGKLLPNGASLWLALDDMNRKRGLETHMSAIMEENGIKVRLDNREHNLGYKAFTVNPDNYIFLANDMRVSADVKLRSQDGMGIQIYTDDENTDALQDITLSLYKFDIGKILSVIPYTPRMSGIMNGDFHAIITPDNMSVSSDVSLNNLFYENTAMGDISSEFVYIPKEDGTHHIDGVLYKDGREIANIVGGYNSENDGNISATLSLKQFPLDFANGFIPDQIVGLNGTGDGEITIEGSTSKPHIDGEIFLENAALVSVPYGVTMKFDDDPVRIVDSNLLLENFQMYANNNQPLICHGNINFSDLDHIGVNLRMKADNFLLIDAKETRRSEAYGKAFVNFYAMATGELSNLNVKGQLDVLSSTDLYYILRDSPITTDNRLKELVTFTDLSAEEQTSVIRPTVDDLSIDMKVNLVEGAHVKCWLNANHSNYLDIMPSGELSMTYRKGDISMNGRCTIYEGEMKYSLPIIPIKTFKIANGSYIEFTGDIMNPRLNITATEKNKASVNINGTNQTVTFDCGVSITKTLNDMGLEFIIDAPENQTVSDELKTKSLEERGKLAVTMLTTGMYLSENNTSSFTMNSALSSFLQSEINNIAGSALRTLDLSVGLENSTDQNGYMHTDYSFKFAKRFWNNRLSISIGGKISTGPDVAGQNQTFFDNVEVQYRISNSSNQYLQLFYKRAVYDNLEGYVDQYGAGYMWKRKLQSFRDIFRFGNKKEKIVTSDSIKNTTNTK